MRFSHISEVNRYIPKLFGMGGRFIGFSLGAGVVTSLMDILFLYFLSFLVKIYSVGTSAVSQIGFFNVAFSLDNAPSLALLLLISQLLRSFMAVITVKATYAASERVRLNLQRNSLLAILYSLKNPSRDHKKYNDLLIVNIQKISDGLFHYLLRVLIESIMSLMLIAYVIYVSGFSIISVLFMGLIIALLVSKYTNKYISTFGVISNNAVSNYNLKIGNFFDGFKSIYFHDNRHEVLGKILESSSLYSSARQKLVILTSIPKIFFELILVASLVILVLMTGGTSPQVISDLVGVAYLAFRIIPFLSQLSAVGMQISYHIPILEQIAELNNPNQSVIDTEIYTEKTRDLVSHKLTISNLRTDVDCLYNHDKTLNINLYSGDILWIDGVSGVGKSTLLDYIVGLHPSPNSLINLNDMLLQRSNCAYSTQTGFAFEADFKSNMFLSSLTSEMIKDASDFFKIDTESILGLIDCKKLSGGQVQKISLLRVLFSNRSVLVFDEPTNGFDDESVKVFFQLLLKWGGDKISIIVSHDSRFFKIASKNLTLRANH